MTTETREDAGDREGETNLEGVEIQRVDSRDGIPGWTSFDEIALFLHEKMQPYHDTLEDVKRGLDYALSDEPGQGGFMVVSAVEDRLAGAVVFLETGMKGYVPGTLLLFVCVDPDLRGRGLGRRIIESGLRTIDGQVKLHVEPDNPARRLYERIGFTNKYLEMRWDRP